MKARKRAIHRAWLVLIACCFMQAGAFGIILSSCGVFFNPICQDLGCSQGALSAYLTFYCWSSCFGMMLVSHVFPKVDCRISISISIIALALAYGAMSSYTQLWQWYLSGIVFGVAGSFVFVVPTPLLLSNWFHKKAGMAIGIATACSGIGGAIFAPVLTFFIELWGWRATYIVAAVFILVICLPWTVTVLHFNPASVGLKPYGYDENTDVSSTDIAQSTSTAECSICKLILTIPFICLFLATGFASCFAGYNNQLPTYALTIGETAMFGAALLSTTQVGNIISKVLIGICIDKFGALKTTIVQIAIITVTFLMFLWCHNYLFQFAAAFFFGSHNSLVSLNIPALFRTIFNEKDYARMLPLSQIGTGIFGGIGIPLVAVSYDVFGNFDIAFIVGAATAILCGGLCVIAFCKNFTQNTTDDLRS